MTSLLLAQLQTICHTHHLIPINEKQLTEFYLPLADTITQWAKHSSTPCIVAINGSPGSGKTTLSLLLQHILLCSQQRATILSLDDCYKTKAERRHLAHTVHPFLRHRGVPGTHDSDLATNTLSQLQSLTTDYAIPLPRFDKTTDDRQPQKTWPIITGPLDIILFEGWCLGITPQTEQALVTPVNQLEETKDAEGIWRRYVNTQIQDDPLFSIDIPHYIYIQVDNFEQVIQNRCEQEKNLTDLHPSYTPTSDQHMRHFLQLFQRLVTHLDDTMPSQAEIMISSDHNRHYTYTYRK